MSYDHHSVEEIERMWAPEPACCAGVECLPQSFSRSVKSARCRCGLHRVTEFGARRTVLWASTNQIVWPYQPEEML